MAGAGNELKGREREKWEQNRNRKLEMKSLPDRARVQVRFCSHVSFSLSACSFLALSVSVLATSL